MGYYARYTGRIDIDPPLPWKVFKDSPSSPAGHSDVRLVIEEEWIETDEGVMTKRRAVAIVPASEEPFKGYRMEEDIQDIVGLARSAASNDYVVFTGHIEALGEDGAQWRIKVIDGHARRFEPTVVWPAESE